MKLKEKEQLLDKIAELQQQVDNTVVEDENLFDVKLGDAAYSCDNYKNIGKDYMWAIEDIKNCIPCKDRKIIEERQKREHLNALLEKFAYENDSVVTEDMWRDNELKKYRILYDCDTSKYLVASGYDYRELNVIHFRSREVCQRAINEVVIPFMEGKDE